MLTNEFQLGTSQLNNCPEARLNPETNMVELRDSKRPGEIVQFTLGAWSSLKETMASGMFDIPA